MVEHSKPKNKINADITLNLLEQNIFNKLLNVIEKKELDLTLRVAGGWVRDKLLGRESQDIDIALDTMTGVAFAKILDENIEGGVKYGIVKRDTNMSKHLETAIIHIDGTSIDLVNLRSESYTAESRVPKIELGTPKEDALRRDLTINSLFYNIQTKYIEDFTELGLKDLEDGFIRTPLDPIQTFMDDPLRILRCVRFTMRFGFIIDPRIPIAALDPLVQDSLASKVSHERIGKEMDLMLSGNNPHLSIKMLYEYKIFKHILKIPPQSIGNNS